MKQFLTISFVVVAMVTMFSSCTMNAATLADVAVNTEVPSDTIHEDAQILVYDGFVVSYNKDLCVPNWVAWKLEAHETTGNLSRVRFQSDSQVPFYCRVEHADYSGSGYDRGHMMPAGDAKWNEQTMNDCFYMTNMCPQVHELNDGGWRVLEEACRRWARQEGAVYIVCGPIFENPDSPRRIRNKVAIPDAYFKVVMSLNPGKEKALGFIYENSDIYQSMRGCAVSVDKVEEITQLDFFPTVAQPLQDKIESMSNYNAVWSR